ncbi:MAK10 [[Candida] subhashii]|uniref:MAK10 n=1 Tax=[Candida] subhashii TaxID=561895 RepID=A0A8J5QS14_9ASCO|nr:MAK10 [[Candida] subhashii]KAG7666448.1 MAK10 [[Candida] subhashii]
MLTLDPLKIENDTENDTELIDITDSLFQSLLQITNNQVVKADQFELLEGTRALEVLNPRLDTGLITLDPHDYEFDCSAPQSIEVIINIQTKLLKCVVHWLMNESLPVTVLSCRYVQTMLENYLTKRSSIFDQCSFYSDRMEQKEEWGDTNGVEYMLVHKVLKVFCMGLCRFIGFVLQIAKTFLYEEEDITTRKMSLNFLEDVMPQFLIDEINDVIEWIIANEINQADVVITQLKVIICLLKIESSISSTQVQFLQPQPHDQIDLSLYSEGIAQITKLQSFTFDESIIPVGTFSKFIQVDMENKNIPLELPNIDFSIACKHLSGIFTTIKTFISKSNQISSINQLQDYLDYNITYPISTFSVFARGLFQYFFIRDDKSIFGSQEIYLPTLCLDMIENLVGGNTIILHNFPSQLSQLKEMTRMEILERYDQIWNDLEAGIFHNLTIYGSNPCRQQQLLSKGLLLWDTLQVSWESFEVEMYQNYKIGDEFVGTGANGGGELAISVTSYIYYTKIKMMIELLLNGFQLELYKPFETFLIYWYADYLLENLNDHLQNRLVQIIIGKIHHLETIIPKRIKKLKTGTKKDQLKQINKHNHEIILPKLTSTLNYNQDYLHPSYKSLQLLLKSTTSFLVALSKLHLIDFTQGPVNNLTSMESLYYLQSTKPDLHNNRNNLLRTLEILTAVKSGLAESKKGFKDVIQYIERNRSKHFLEDSTNIEEWYGGYLKSIEMLEENVAEVSRLISMYKNDLGAIKRDYKLVIESGVHRYIPKFSIIKKLD